MPVRRFREYRRLYQTYPQLKRPIVHYLSEHNTVRRLATAELQDNRISTNSPLSVSALKGENILQISAARLFRQLPCTHLIKLSTIDALPLKRLFYEIETIRGCWSARELDRQIAVRIIEE